MMRRILAYFFGVVCKMRFISYCRILAPLSIIGVFLDVIVMYAYCTDNKMGTVAFAVTFLLTIFLCC